MSDRSAASDARPERRPRGLTRAIAIALLLFAAPAFAQDAAPHPTTIKHRIGDTLLFLGGGALGLGVHESGHFITGAIFGANPRVAPLHYGFIPFFKVEHDTVTRKKEFVISSAGFWMQYADSEWILTARPDIRHEDAPLLKGVLAFDVGTSVVYSIAAFGKIGPVERDTRGVADSLGRTGASEPAVGLLILAPAVFDSWRYLDPHAAWPKWASRGSKVALVLLTFAAGRPGGH